MFCRKIIMKCNRKYILIFLGVNKDVKLNSLKQIGWIKDANIGFQRIPMDSSLEDISINLSNSLPGCGAWKACHRPICKI